MQKKWAGSLTSGDNQPLEDLNVTVEITIQPVAPLIVRSFTS